MFQNGQTHFKNLAAFAARFLKCVWPFWDIMNKELIYKKNKVKKYYISMLKKNMIFDNFVIKDYDSFKNYVT